MGVPSEREGLLDCLGVALNEDPVPSRRQIGQVHLIDAVDRQVVDMVFQEEVAFGGLKLDGLYIDREGLEVDEANLFAKIQKKGILGIEEFLRCLVADLFKSLARILGTGQ